MENAHWILDHEPELLLTDSGFDCRDLDYLIALDTCNFRMSNCNWVLGDWDYRITKKKLKAKIKLLDVVKDIDVKEKSKILEIQQVKS